MTTYLLKNGRPLVVTSLEFVEKVYSLVGVKPVVCMIAADELPKQEPATLSTLIDSLILLRCRQFICCGKVAEWFHDFLDSRIELLGKHDVVTTWHDESPEEVLEFLLNPLGIKAEQEPDLFLVVFLEPGYGAAERLLSAIQSYVATA